MLGAIVNYLTRSTMGIAAPTVMKDLGISVKEYSWITGAFQLGIMLQPVCGYVLDTLGLRTGFAVFAAAWSLIAMAHGLVHSWQGFAFLRGFLGLAEGSAQRGGTQGQPYGTWPLGPDKPCGLSAMTRLGGGALRNCELSDRRSVVGSWKVQGGRHERSGLDLRT